MFTNLTLKQGTYELYTANDLYITWNFLGSCEPYSEEACRLYAVRAGLKLGGRGYKFASGDYGTKGCYAYESGSYKGSVFYGLGGTEKDISKALDLPKYRPEGYDCFIIGS